MKSKTNQGGLSSKVTALKTVNIYPDPNPSHCPVRIFEKYVSLLPKEGCHEELYLHPLTKLNSTQWFSDQPLGVNTLRDTVKRLANAAGLEGKFINHSLRATAASRMYQAGVPEKFIKEVTGHKSDAVQMYEHTSEQMKRRVSAMLSKPTEIDLTGNNEHVTTYKMMKPDVHPVLQCIQSSGLTEIIENIPKENVKSMKLNVEIECYEK